MLKRLLIACSFLVGLTGCTEPVVVSPTQVVYDYTKNLNDADRYNPGSTYYWKFILEREHKRLTVDYGVFEIPTTYQFTLPNEVQKVTIKGTAIIYVQLMRNPDDKNHDIPYKNDKYVRYWAENVPSNLLDGRIVFNKLLGEATDEAFRSSFLENEKYKTFDDIEKNMKSIRDDIKEKLNQNAEAYKLKIVAIKVSDPIVPLPIEESRNTMLKLEQDKLNQVKKIEIRQNIAAAEMAVNVREAINDVLLDRIAGQTNKSYLLLKTLNRAITEKAPLNLSITPDFMRYIDSDNSGKTDKTIGTHEFDVFNAMSDEELKAYFNKSEKN